MKRQVQTMLVTVFIALAGTKDIAAASLSSTGEVRFRVTIEALPPAVATRQALIKTHVITAAKMWTDSIESRPCEIPIGFTVREVVENDPKKLGYGKSRRSVS